MPAYCFDFNVYKQANENMLIRSWQHYRRFYRFYTTTITYIHARIQEIFVGFGGGGGGIQAQLTEKSSDVVFILLFFVSPQLILQRESSDHGFFKENYH